MDQRTRLRALRKAGYACGARVVSGRRCLAPARDVVDGIAVCPRHH